MVFEFVVIYRRRHFPSSALVVDAHIKRSDSMVGFLILIVEFGAVECVCAITLGCDAQLRPDVEAAVVAQRQVGIALSFLEVAVFGASVRAFVSAAYGIGLFPLSASESHLQPALCPEAAKAAGFHICLDAVCACFLVTMFMAPLNADVPNTRDDAPSIISTWSMSASATGKSEALCPVCGLEMFTPLRKIAIWSKVPPLIEMSVCTPKPPR